MLEIIIDIILSALIALCLLLDAYSASRALERRVKKQQYGSTDDKCSLGDEAKGRQGSRLF